MSEPRSRVMSELDTNAAPPEAPRLGAGGLPELEGETPSVPMLAIDTTNPDYASLTPQQLADLNAKMLEDAIPTRPLMSSIEPLLLMREEYERGGAHFVEEIDFLQKKGYMGVRRTRGDGDCFYRSFAFAYIERLILLGDELAVATALSHLETTLILLETAGFQKLVFEDFYDVFHNVLEQAVRPGPNRLILTTTSLLEAFQSPEVSNSIVVYLRFLTSAHMRLDADAYSAFIFHPETGDEMELIPFCENFVEACGREADHVQVTALSRVMKANVSVAYMDGRAADEVAFVDFVYAEDAEMQPLVLLYRPGHYDILEMREKD